MPDTEEVEPSLTRAWGLLIGVFAGLVVFVFYLAGYFEIGKFAGFSTAAIMCAARIEWDYSKRRWFWPLIIGIALAHAVMLYFIKLGDENYPALLFSPLFIVDIFLIVWGIDGFYRYFDDRER